MPKETAFSLIPPANRSKNEWLTLGVWAAQNGQKERARRLLGQLIRQNARHEQAWLWLAAVSDHPRQARACLRQVLRINPQNPHALEGLRQLDRQLQHLDAGGSSSTTVQHSQAHLLRRWLGICLLTAALVIVLGGFLAQAWVQQERAALSIDPPTPTLTATPTLPTATPTRTVPQRVAELLPGLEQSWGERDWPGANDLLNQILLIDADYPGLSTARCDTVLQWADDRVKGGQIKEAYRLYRQAQEICPQTEAIQVDKSLALDYLSGKWRYDRGRWAEAVQALQTVYQADPQYADVRQLLHTACVSWAEIALNEGDLDQARQASEEALTLEANDVRAAAVLAEVQRRSAPTPTPVPLPGSVSPRGDKLIEINLSRQRMYVWQGDTLLYNWVCSTGEPGRPTAAGRFQVLNKIPEAWASTWNLRMPYWLGIYQAGPLQNGIHALPILPNGQMLWAGYLGSRVSYGCVILSTENARTLYNWADVGTSVSIHY